MLGAGKSEVPYVVGLAGASVTAPLTLVGTALVLGLRHGVDWDHIAAIADITGTVAADAQVGQGAVSGARTGRQAMLLATTYALGHGAVVATLGAIALVAGKVLPDWIDPILERVVGTTLVALGVWILWSAIRSMRATGAVVVQSRWMLVGAGVRRAWHALTTWGHGHAHDGVPHLHRIERYGVRSAFGVGMIHGIGAETGTQVLLIASIGGADAQGLGGAMLGAFVVGLIASNAVIAALASAGFLATARAQMVLFTSSLVVAAFSVMVGVTFIVGGADQLPDLNAAFGALFGN